MKACYVLLPLIMAALMIGPALGQTPYKLPPKEVVAILDAPLPPLPIVSPTRDSLLLVDVRYYPSIAELAEPVLRLAGVRINPARRLHATQIRGHRPYGQAAGQCSRASGRAARGCVDRLAELVA